MFAAFVWCSCGKSLACFRGSGGPTFNLSRCPCSGGPTVNRSRSRWSGGPTVNLSRFPWSGGPTVNLSCFPWSGGPTVNLSRCPWSRELVSALHGRCGYLLRPPGAHFEPPGASRGSFLDSRGLPELILDLLGALGSFWASRGSPGALRGAPRSLLGLSWGPPGAPPGGLGPRSGLELDFGLIFGAILG